MVVAEVQGLGQWQSLEGARASVSVQLERTWVLRVKVEGKVDRSALTVVALFENGRCVAFERDGEGCVARGLQGEGAVVLADAPGWTPFEEAVSPDTKEVTATLRPLVDVDQTCPNEAKVRWRGLFEQREVDTDGAGRFRFEQMMATSARVECKKGADVLWAWRFDPESGELQGYSSDGDDDSPNWKPSQDHARCGQVEVVDAEGRPVEGALATAWNGAEGRGASGLELSTNARGTFCDERLLYGAELHIEAPAALGGSCAGEQVVHLERWDPSQNKAPVTRVVLTINPRLSDVWRGRVVTEAGLPVARASVILDGVSWPTDGGDCGPPVNDSVETRADGTFETPPVPRGKLALVVRHAWYAPLDAEVTVPSPPRDLVLDRGASWTGRLLYAGAPIREATVFLSDESGRIESVVPEADGAFAFRGFAAGKARLRANLKDESPFGRRTLEVTRVLEANEAVQADLVLSGGGTIAGQVVAPDGGVPKDRYVQAFPDGDGRNPGRARDEVIVAVDPEGRFTFRALAIGAWNLRAYSSPAWVSANTGATDVRVPGR
jgi:hypothetical protein